MVGTQGDADTVEEIRCAFATPARLAGLTRRPGPGTAFGAAHESDGTVLPRGRVSVMPVQLAVTTGFPDSVSGDGTGPLPAVGDQAQPPRERHHPTPCCGPSMAA